MKKLLIIMTLLFFGCDGIANILGVSSDDHTHDHTHDHDHDGICAGVRVASIGNGNDISTG